MINQSSLTEAHFPLIWPFVDTEKGYISGCLLKECPVTGLNGPSTAPYIDTKAFKNAGDHVTLQEDPRAEDQTGPRWPFQGVHLAVLSAASRLCQQKRWRRGALGSISADGRRDVLKEQVNAPEG